MPKIIATGSCMSRLGLQQVKAGTFFQTQCRTAIVSSNQSREWVDGSWVMGQMGHENRMGHMGHGSLGVDP